MVEIIFGQAIRISRTKREIITGPFPLEPEG